MAVFTVKPPFTIHVKILILFGVPFYLVFTIEFCPPSRGRVDGSLTILIYFPTRREAFAFCRVSHGKHNMLVLLFISYIPYPVKAEIC